MFVWDNQLTRLIETSTLQVMIFPPDFCLLFCLLLIHEISQFPTAVFDTAVKYQLSAIICGITMKNAIYAMSDLEK